MISKQYAALVLLLTSFLIATAVSANEPEFLDGVAVNRDLSDHSANYQGDLSNIAVIGFSGNYDRRIEGVSNVEARQVVAQEFYRYHPDQYDFLVIFTRISVDSGDADAFAISYENDVQGIGIPLFDNSLIMGSERLQTTIDMTEITDWELNPSGVQYDNTLDTLVHEMMHRWGVFVSFQDENNQISNLTLGRDDAHWNYFLNSNASVMYGALWNDLGNGDFKTQAVRKSLSPLDLYLMGFADASAVPDFFVIDNGTPGDREDFPSLVGTQVSGNRVDISIDDIIAAEGVRIPGVSDSQHAFNFKFILLVPTGQEANAQDIGGLVVLQREFQKRFFAETSGMGTIIYPEMLNNPAIGEPNTLSYDLTTNQEVDLATAELFLLNSYLDVQNHWQDKPATMYRDTALAIETLRDLNQPMFESQVSDWIAGQRHVAQNHDDLAWLILSNSLTPAITNNLYDELLQSKNTDGGWGLNEDSGSTVYDTALVLKAMMNVRGAEFTPPADSLTFIQNQFNPDGGVGYTVGGQSSLSSSAMLLSIIYDLTQNTESEQRLIDFILGQQNPDGGFGIGQSTTHETAMVIDALTNASNLGQASALQAAKEKLETMQSVDGSFEGSVYSTALALDILVNDSRANLSINSAQLSDSQAVAGEQVAVEYVVSNTGGSAADSIPVAVIIDQQIIATDSISTLAVGEQINGQLAFDTSMMLGSVELIFMVDHENTITEPNETDNSAVLNLEVLAQSSTPELAIDRSSVVLSTDYFDALPFNYTASFNVSNLSTSNVSDIRVSLQRKLDEFTWVELQSHVINVDAGQNEPVDFDVLIGDAEDDIDLIFLIDPENQINEVNEDNNELKTTLRKLSTIDLSVDAAQISITNQLVLGQQATITFDFTNLGTQLSPGFSVKTVYQGSGGPEVLYENELQEMLGGQTLTRQFPWVPQELGSYSLDFVLDDANEVAEIDETNNTISIPVTVNGNTSTNLSIIDGDININPDPGLTGQTLEIFATIQNTSNTDSGPFDVNFYHQQFDQPSELIEATLDLPSIPAGGDQIVSVTVDDYSWSGDVTFVVEVDPADEIPEFDENDNVGLNTLRVLNKPDGYVSSGGFALTPSAPVLGSPLNVDVVIGNTGEQDLIDVEAKLYVKSNTSLNEVGSVTIPLIEAGQSLNQPFGMTFPNDPAFTSLVVSIDEPDAIDEVNENNNQAELIIENQSQDFYVTEKYFSPNGDGIKDTTNIVFNLDTTDDFEIKIINSFDEVIKSFPVFVSRRFGDVMWDGRNDDQKIANDGEYLIIISGANSGLQKLITVWLDTNRSTLGESLAKDDGYITDLNCSVKTIGGSEAENAAKYSLDGKFIYLKSYFPVNSSEQKGLFALSIDGSSITSIIPPSFTANNQVESFQVLENGHVLLKTKINLSNQQELWYLNTNNQSFYQLDTQNIFSFNVEISHLDYSIIGFSGQPFDHLKVSHAPNQTSEPITDIYASGSFLMKVNGGWIERSNDQNIWFRFADLISADVRLGDVVYGISDDDSRALIQRNDEAVLYGFGGAGPTEIKVINFIEDSSFPNRLFYGPDNQFIWFNNGLIGLYGSNGELRHSVDQPFTIDYFKDRILDSYGTLDQIPVDTEIGTFLVAFDQLENPRIDFDNIDISWLSNSELTIRFFARFSADIDPNLIGGISSQFQLDETFYYHQRVDFQNYPVVDEFESRYTVESITELDSRYYLSTDQVIRKGVGYDFSDASNNLLEDFEILETYPSKTFPKQVKSLLLKNLSSNYSNNCSEVGDNGIVGVYLPKDNLTAFLDPKPNSTGVEINGTLFDAHLDRYEVYYANSQSPETWNLIGVGTHEKDRQLLFNWLPPVSGAYRLKLLVFDKAGNSKEIIQSVQVSRGASTTTVPVVEPIYFSPNGDGVLDTVSVEYESLQAGEVLITVTNSDGQVVNSWLRDYAQAGLIEQLIWDGRDENNQLLEDGIYQIKIGGFKYQVEIDTQPPGYGIDYQYRRVEDPDGYEITKFHLHLPFSFRGNLWRIFNGGNVGTGLGSPTMDPVPQKFTDNTWLAMDGPSFIMRPETYFENREIYRYQRSDLAGNVGGSANLSIAEKLVKSELLKPQNAMPGDRPLVLPFHYHWIEDGAIHEYHPIDLEIAPRIVDWNISDQLGFSFQSLTDETIESIRMTTSYENEIGASISSSKMVELADYEVVARYYPDFAPAPSSFPPGSFQYTYFDNEIAVYLLEFDQDDFPDVDVPINTEFEVTFVNNPVAETISFDIQFNLYEAPIFIEIPPLDHLFSLGLEENESEAFFEVLDQVDSNSEKSYLWFFADNQQLNSESWVNLTRTATGEPGATLTPIYSAESNEFISQVFETELPCGIEYEAEWFSSGIEFAEPVTADVIKGCKFNILQDFYLNANCDQNAPPSEAMTFQLFGDLESNPETDPVLLEIYWYNRGVGYELVYSDTDFSDDVLVVEGFRKYATRVNLPTNEYVPGKHKFYAKYSYLNSDPAVIGFELVNNTQVAEFDILSPAEGQFFCGQNADGGIVEGGKSEVMLDLEMTMPAASATPYAVNLTRFVDGINLDEYDPFDLGGVTTYENINVVDFSYNDFNLIKTGETFRFAAPLISQELTLNLLAREGSAILQVETINSTGVSQCHAVEIQYDTLVKAETVFGNSHFYLSPLTAGLLNYANVSAEESVSVQVEVYQDTTLIEEIASFGLLNGEQQELYWDGMSGGSNLPDGDYNIEIRITDTCGNWIIRKTSVTIDSTAPNLNFVYPSDGENVSSLVEILFHVGEPNLAQLNLEYEYLNFLTPIDFQLISSDVVIPLEYLGQWDLSQLPLGTYPVHLSATDLAGNEASQIISVNYIQSQDLIWQFGLSERLISPNSDGFKDRTEIELGLNMNSDVTLTVVDTNDVLVKSLSTVTLNAGVHLFEWDGSNDLGQVVIDGTYQIKVMVTELGNPGNTTEMLLTLETDTTQPVTVFSPNNSVIKGEGQLIATISDENLANRSATLQPLEPVGAVVNVQAAANGSNEFPVDLQSLSESLYVINTIADDLAGNQQAQSHQFTIDNTVPVVELNDPKNLAIVGGGTAEIIFEGRIDELNLAEYKIFISANIATPVWDELFQSTELQDGQFNHIWPITEGDGEYLIRVWVMDQAGWETEVIHEITIDTQAPDLILTSPLDASLQGEAIEFNGSVLDDNLSFYQLSYKAQNNSNWTLIHSGVDPINAGPIFTWQPGMASGDFDVRLLAGDATGLTSELVVSFTIDTTPPDAPTFLTADLLLQKDVSLNWTASTSPDLVGYYVYRNNTALNSTPISTTTYVDLDVPEGEYSYWVIAADNLGNLSDPSNVVELLIDRTGPLVSLQQPYDNAVVNGVLDIIGTAEDVSDFYVQRLYIRPVLDPVPGQLLAESFLPSLAELLGQLDTQALVQDSQYIIRLEALDFSGNVGVIEHTVLIDNTAPSAPLNLTHQVLGQDDVQLDWQANSESDLAGYLVYRNGSIISGNGTPESGVITDVTYTDVDVVDGDHVYHVVAVDVASNISDPSNAVHVNINRRPPDTLIVSPQDGLKFENPIDLLANSTDEDTAHITFEYSTDNVLWSPLGQAVNQPYSVVLNPQSLGLSYGQVYVRAYAEDLGGQVDASPAQISLEYTDITPPTIVDGLQVVALGDQVQLSWNPNIEPDLQGHRVLRKQLAPNLENEFTELNGSLITANNYSDAGVSDGLYRYRVVAVDDHDNDSVAAQSADIPVWSLKVDQPYSPVLSPSGVSFEGASVYPGEVNITLTDINGSQTLPSSTTQPDGSFTINVATLSTGLNNVTIFVEDSFGNQSKSIDRAIEVSPTPLVPLNLSSNVDGFDVTLNWQSPGTETVGYLPSINQAPVFATERVISGVTFNSSSNNSSAANVIDEDDQTVWRPASSDVRNGLPTYIELIFDQPKWITQTSIHWDQDYYYDGHVSVPSTYLLQYQSSVGWITQEDYTGSEQASVTFTGNLPYLAIAVRIWMPLEEFSSDNIRVREIAVIHQPFTDQLSLHQTMTDGNYDWQVSAINQYGFASDNTAIESFSVGDVTLPDTVTLSGNPQNASSIELTWTASASPDVAFYRVYRNNVLIFTTSDANTLIFLNQNLANGDYDYHVTAVDAAGNVSIDSNVIQFSVDQQILLPPTGLTLSTVTTGGALSLTWDLHASPDWASFKLYRSLSGSSGFQLVVDQPAIQFVDSGLINGVTYYYHVTAIDLLGNESLPSNVVSGTPNDLTIPLRPIIVAPTTHGNPINVNQFNSDISGTSSPGVEVDLYRNGDYLATTSASEVFTENRINLNRFFDDTRFNEANSLFIYYDNNTDQFTIADPDNAVYTALIGNQLRDYFWNHNGDTVYAVSGYGDQSELKSFGLDGIETATLLTGYNISRASVSPDETQVFYWGDGLNPDTSTIENGLWLYTFNGSVHEKIELGQNIGLYYKAIEWLPDGTIAFNNFPNDIFNDGHVWLYNLQSGLSQMAPGSTTSLASLTSSNDGSHLYYEFNNNGNIAVKRYRIADGQETVLSREGIDIELPLVGDDVDQVFVNVDCCSKQLIDIITDEVLFDLPNSGYRSAGSWLDDGRVFLLADDSVIYLIPPGYFEFTLVELLPGLNEFYAVARKANGLESGPSDSIEITLSSLALADLVIEPNFLQILPTEVNLGEQISGTILVKNSSLVDVESAHLLIELIDPDLSSQVIFPAPVEFNLAAGDSIVQNFFINDLSSLGEYTIRVVADYNQQVVESNENNNSTVKVFQVIDDLNPDISINLNANTLAPGEALVGQLNVYNPGSPYTGSVVLRITDLAGFPTGYEIVYDIVELNPGMSWQQTFNWDTADVFSGQYVVEATLLSNNQQVIEQTTTAFEITEFAAFDLLLNAEPQVVISSTADFAVNVEYSFGNVSQSGQLVWQVFDSSQQLVWTESQATGVMLPGYSGTFEQSWFADDVGDYLIKVTLNTPVTSHAVMTPLEVIDVQPELQLSGHLDDMPAGVILGQLWHINYQISNVGQIDVTDVPINLALWDSGLNQLIEQEQLQVSLSADTDIQLNTQWQTGALGLGNHVLILTADLTAYGESASYLLDTLTIQTVDAIGPQINVLNPLDGGFYPSGLEVRTDVSDQHAAVQQVEFLLDGNSETVIPGQQLSSAYQHWITGLDDGPHQLTVRAVDDFANESSQSVNFMVDGMPPNITISGVDEGGLYNHNVQPVITVTDANLATSQAILNGVPFTSGADISAEGSYVMIVSATDLAGNTRYERLFFNIDLTPPTVVITYPVNGSETNQATTLVTGTTEINAVVSLTNGAYSDSISADLAGNFSFIDVPLTNGSNTIAITATDLAGNPGAVSQIQVNLVDDIDVIGNIALDATHPLGQDLNVGWQVTNQNDFPVSQLNTEVNIYRMSDNQLVSSHSQVIDISASGSLADSSLFTTTGLSPGDHRIELRVEFDQIWQVLDDHLLELQDVQGPQINVLLPTSNQITNATVDLSVQATDIHSEVTDVSYQLDGDVSWVPLSWNGVEYVGQLNLTHGSHQILFRATDAFANETTTQSTDFTVDTNGPVINVVAPTDGLITNQPITIDFAVTDDHTFEVTALLDQNSVNNGQVINDEGDYELIITATDEVENESSITVDFIIDTTAPVVVVTSPASDTQNTTGNLDISGSAEDRNTITIKVNGLENTVKTDAKGQFTLTNQALQVGMNVIEVTATDQAGNVSLPVIRNVEYIQVGAIQGRVWQDDNQDGVINAGELGFNQVALRLTDANNGTMKIITDASGLFEWEELEPGQYTLEVTEIDLLTNWMITTANNPTVVNVEVNHTQEVNFGFYQEKPIIDLSASANNVRGRLLLLMDPATAEFDTNQCVGVSNYKLQRWIDHEWTQGDVVTASLFDAQGGLLQTESATFNDFVNNGQQIVDQQPETSQFNLLLHPVENGHISASVINSSSANPAVIPAAYRLELNLQTSQGAQTWSGALVSEACELFTHIGLPTGELQFADIGLQPPVPSDDPNGSAEAPYLASQQVQLENILRDAGWSYTLTSDAASFEAEFDSGQFVAYGLLAENVVLPASVQTGLISVVDDGAGLLVSSGHDNLSSQFYSGMGVNVSGNHLNPANLVLLNSPFSDAGVLGIAHDEQVLRVSLAGAQSAATFIGTGIQPPENVAIAWQEGIDGHQVFSAMDWLIQATDSIGLSPYVSLIKDVLTYIHPLGLSNELGFARAVQLDVQNMGRAVDGHVQVLLPAQVSLAYTDVPITPNQDGFTFNYDLVENQSMSYEFWLTVNTSPATVTFDLHINDDITVFESLDLILVAGERPDLKATISNCQAGIGPDHSVNYQFVIQNSGNKDITSALAFTDFGTGLNAPSWSCLGSLGGTCQQINGQGDLVGQVIDLPVGSRVTYSFITQTSTPSPTGVMPNATVMMPEGVSDVKPEDNEAIDFDLVYPFLFKDSFECMPAGQEGA